MKASEQEVELSGFTDPDSDEVLHWQRVEREALALCDPLSRMVGHKNICWATGVSGGQLTREISPVYDNRLSLAVALYVLRHSQNEKLARVLICDGAGYRLPDPQKRKATTEEELRALREVLREAGPVGMAALDAAARRVRSGK